MGAMAAAMQHQVEMEGTTDAAEYVRNQIQARQQALSELKGSAGFLGFARNRKAKLKLAAKGGVSDEEEQERQLQENLWKYYRLLPPHGKFKRRWDTLIQVLVMYNYTFIPMSLAFGYVMDDVHMAVDYLIDAFFVLDMIVSMSTVSRPSIAIVAHPSYQNLPS